MSNPTYPRQEISEVLIINGNPVTIKLIDGPVIDDILVGEAMIQAHSLTTNSDLSSRRVPRDIRDYLIRLGVEQ